MKDKEKKGLNMRWQWTKFIVVVVLFLLFLYWVKSWWGLIVVPFIYDVYITKRIRWQWWKDSERPVRAVMSWIDAIVFALVAVYFINLFFFQNYVIPSSSLEKSLLRGDYLFVSKVSYGPRIPQTPLTMPLTQHTLPLFGCKSYISWPQWEYRRVKGLGRVEQNDIVVFNYPAGDTVMSNPVYEAQDYYQACYVCGRQQLSLADTTIAAMDASHRWDFYGRVMATGAAYIRNNAAEFGTLTARPTDRRENYVKRCVGLPGQTLQIKDRRVYINGKLNKEPEEVQYSYYVTFRRNTLIEKSLLEELDITAEDLGLTKLDEDYVDRNGGLIYDDKYPMPIVMPMTNAAYKALAADRRIVEKIVPVTDGNHADNYKVYPLNGFYGWTRDNYGPVWIPKKGETVKLTLENLPVYERPIRVYEKNRLEVRDGEIYINGSRAESYTFKMDYYWMMGDNRHNSADSRYWGFVPEDHVVGKPLFIWLSINPESFGQKIRWNRLFRFVDNIR